MGQPALQPGWPLAAPVTFLLLALIYPWLEELVFRGALQGVLFTHTWGRRAVAHITLANLLTSLLFTGFHFISHTPLWAALVFVPALIFGYFRDKYQAVLPAIFLHVFYNTGYFWLFPP